MIMKKFLLALFYFTIVVRIFPQGKISEREIKLSGKYYWGEGIGATAQDAQKDALLNLQYKISVTISASSSSQMSENSQGIQSSFSKNIRMFSTLKLKGVEYFQKERSDKKIQVDAYLSKEKYKKLITEISNDVIDRVKLAEKKEREEGLISAIPLYYRAYLNTFYSPEPIPYNSVTYHQDYNNVRFFLATKVRSYLTELTITQDSISVDPSTPDLITIFLNVTYLKANVSNVEIAFNLPGNPKQRVEKGRTKIFLYSQPSNIFTDYEVNLNILFEDNSDLEDFNKQFGITEKQKIRLDFSRLVKFDFKAKLLPDSSLEFDPVVKNLSVSSVEWNFGSGATSNDSKAIYRFSDGKPHKVTLVVNNLKNLKVTKLIDKTGKVLEKEVFNSAKNKVELNPVVKELLSRKTFDTIIELLKNFKDQGKLLFSLHSEDFFDIARCYGIVVDPTSRRVVALLTPGKTKRKDILTNTIVNDIREKFKGKGIIWFQLN